MAKAVFFNVLREAAGVKEAEIADECRTVAEAIRHLVGRYEGLGKKLFGSDGVTVRAGVSVLLDGRKVPRRELATRELGRDGELSFFEIIGGG